MNYTGKKRCTIHFELIRSMMSLVNMQFAACCGKIIFLQICLTSVKDTPLSNLFENSGLFLQFYFKVYVEYLVNIV